jgi:hypothetical protein
LGALHIERANNLPATRNGNAISERVSGRSGLLK